MHNIPESLHNTPPLTPLTAARKSRFQHGTLFDETHDTTQRGTQRNKLQQARILPHP
jgi:hypothetical protein